ncbi:hypothetical protein ES332_A12G300400v1 [Gossypium tomentosum]|uniref:Uncharacterized protein n=3 Tax=Gossypium TaxID=3633 RepID=A0A5D2N3R0_GOSTO|nr:hypothetical protein ES332_A12G300400v1 [Gossypium tomentosum]
MLTPPKVPFMAATGMSRLAKMASWSLRICFAIDGPWILDCSVTYWRKLGLMKRRWPSIGRPIGPGGSGEGLVLMMSFLTNREK